MFFPSFRHSTWTCFLAVLFISYRQDYTCSWFIFILANSCHYFNYDHFSRTLHSRLIVYADANSDEKGCTSFKRRNKTKERKASVLISLFGAICLISGYVLAANPLYFMSLGDVVGLLYATTSIFLIPSLVTAGTYFFFSQISFYSFVY